jgi:PKD repeat protein
MSLLLISCEGDLNTEEAPQQNATTTTTPTAELAYAANQQDFQFDGGSSSGGNEFAWNFGDGSTATGTRPFHHYATGGAYTVTLSVTDASGTVGKTSQTVWAGVVRTGFETGSLSPMSVCTTAEPNFATPVWIKGEGLTDDAASGDTAIKVFWNQSAYDGTRMKKGAEICSPINLYKEGWVGFRFYLPAKGYPLDKEAALFQVFNAGGCSSWAAMLTVVNNSLHLSHRGSCGTPTNALLVSELPRDQWVNVRVHVLASQASAGKIQVWVGDAPQEQPTYSATNINFGFGTWDTATDTLAAGNELYFKFGQYDYDTENYTAGETRTSYYDNIHIQPFANVEGWQAVDPASPGYRYTGTAAASSVEHVVGRTAEFAFDGDSTTMWQARSGRAWLQYRYPLESPSRLSSYTITSSPATSARDPSAWSLQGSSDGLNWTTLDQQTGQIFSSRGQVRTFPVSSSLSFRYYRLDISANNGDAAAMSIGELSFQQP